MWSQIDISHSAKKEVVALHDKVKERESLVVVTNESVGVEARKLKEELASSSLSPRGIAGPTGPFLRSTKRKGRRLWRSSLPS